MENVSRNGAVFSTKAVTPHGGHVARFWRQFRLSHWRVIVGI